MGGVFGKKRKELTADVDEDEEDLTEDILSPEEALVWKEHGVNNAIDFVNKRRRTRYNALKREEQLLLREQAKLARRVSRISKISNGPSGKSSKRFKKKKRRKPQAITPTESEVSSKATTVSSPKPKTQKSRQTTATIPKSRISGIRTTPNSRSPSPSPSPRPPPDSRIPTIQITPSTELITQNLRNNNIRSAVITPVKVSARRLDAPSDVLNSNVTETGRPVTSDDNNNSNKMPIKLIKLIKLRPNVSPQTVYVGQAETKNSKKISPKSVAESGNPKPSKKLLENAKQTPSKSSKGGTSVKNLFAKPDATKPSSSLLGRITPQSGSSFKPLLPPLAGKKAKAKTKKKSKKKQQQKKKKKRKKSAPEEDKSRPNCKGCKKIRERSEYLTDPATFARIEFEQKNTKILRNSLRAWEEEQANSNAQGRCKRRKSQPRRRHSSCDPVTSNYCPDFEQQFYNIDQFECFDRLDGQTVESEQYYPEPQDDCAYVVEYCIPTAEDDRDDVSSNCSSNSDHGHEAKCIKPRKSRCKKRRRRRK